MMVIGKPFILLVLSTGPVYVKGATKKGVPRNYANKVDIPSGVYKAVKKDNNHISDVLPMINDFKLYVESYPDGQRAQLEIVTDGAPPLISDVMPIRKYSKAAVYKGLEFDGRRYAADSFYLDGKPERYFLELYQQIGLPRERVTDKDMILCKMQEDSTLKIGVWPKRNLPDRELTKIGGVNDFITLTKVNEHVIAPTPHVEVEAPDQFPLLRATLKRPLTREKELVQAKRLKVNDDKVLLTTPEAIPDGVYVISEINDVIDGTFGIHTDRNGERWGTLMLRTQNHGNPSFQRLPLKLMNGIWELIIIDDKQRSDAMNIKKALRLEETTTTEHPFHIIKSKVWYLMVGDEPNPVILLQLQPLIPHKS